VLKAQRRGDILRIRRNLHPGADRTNAIADAEAAVAQSAQMLENLTREHQGNLDRLNALRKRQSLTPSASPVPTIRAPFDESLTVLIGRVTRRAPLTHDSKTSGELVTTGGDTIRWTAASNYVDALDVLFDGAPIQIAGTHLGTGAFSIQGVLPAPRPFWKDDEDYAALAEAGPINVMSAAVLKKRLRREHGHACQACKQELVKRVHCSIADLPTGPVLVCRPCKQRWNDAGRPSFIPAAPK